MQTSEALAEGIRDILRRAIKDNVIYMELYLTPSAHTRGDMHLDKVIEVALNVIQETEFSDHIRTGIVLCCSTRADDPVVFFHVAELTVRYQGKGVVGFGVVGGEIE